MYQRGAEEYVSNFELFSLAFADLVTSEINNEKTENVDICDKKLGPFETIRCICGKNEESGALIQCSECQCYQHRDCIELNTRRGGTYKCPFCRLQLDGVDPFRELKTWIEEKDTEIKNVHHLLSEVAQLDAKIQASAYDAYGASLRGQNINMLRQSLTRNMQEAIQKIRELSSN